MIDAYNIPFRQVEIIVRGLINQADNSPSLKITPDCKVKTFHKNNTLNHALLTSHFSEIKKWKFTEKSN